MKIILKKNIQIEKHQETEKGDIFTVSKGFYLYYKDNRLWIPKGFQCDGASIPKFLWGIVFPAADLDALIASIFHDYAYRFNKKNWSKFFVDWAFFRLLLKNKINFFSALKAYIGVTIFGWPTWLKNKRRKI